LNLEPRLVDPQHRSQTPDTWRRRDVRKCVEKAVASVSRSNTSARPPTEPSRRIDRTLTPLPACPHGAPREPGPTRCAPRPSPFPRARPTRRRQKIKTSRSASWPAAAPSRASPAGLIAATSRANADASARNASRGFLERLVRDASIASRAGHARAVARTPRRSGAPSTRRRASLVPTDACGRSETSPPAPPPRDAARPDSTRVRAMAPPPPVSTSPLALPFAHPARVRTRPPRRRD
jgi:hypothetical protein